MTMGTARTSEICIVNELRTVVYARATRPACAFFFFLFFFFTYFTSSTK